MHPPSPPPRLQKRRADSPPRPPRQRQPAVPLSPAKLHATNRPRLTVTVSTPNRDSRAASTPLGIREGVYPRLPVSTPSLGIPGIPGTLASSPPSRKRQPTVTVSTPPRDSRAASTPQGIREGVYPRLPVSTPWLGIHGIPGTLTSSPPSKRQPPVTVSTPPRDSRAASTPLGIREGVYPRLPVSTPWLGIHGIPGTLTSSPPSSKKRPAESPPPPRAARRRLRLGEADFSSNLTTFAATAERHRPEVLFGTHRYYSKSLHY